MWQLRHDQKMIDHQVVMVNAMNTRGNSSVIKFGGWDLEALTPGTSLTVLKTENEKSWTLKSSLFSYNGTNLFTSVVEKNIDLNPHLPYLYIPDADWTHFAYSMHNIYATTGYDIDCDFGGNYCRWATDCNTLISAGMEKELKITMKGDTATTFDFITKPGTLFIDGKNFGMTENSFCYLPVFRHHLTNPDTTNAWYLGSLFMMEYVVVYDNTPFDEHGLTYCQIGFGVADPLRVEKQLETLYDGAAAILPTDMSHKIGAWDPLPPKPKPTPPKPTPTPPPTPPGPFEQFIIDHLAWIIIGILLGCICVVLIVRKIMKGPPKTYYNGMYSLADEKVPRINEN